jgi:uncharacterized protein YbaA (DUF1428 family)
MAGYCLFSESDFCNYTFTPLPIFIVLSIATAMEKTGSATEMEETGNYLQLFFYRAPKKNHESIAKNLKQFVPWFKKHGVRIEYYQFGNSETQAAIDSAKKSGMDVLDSIAKTLSTAEDEEEVWMEMQYFRDHKHCEDIYAKMMQDKSLEPLGNEFFSLVTQGKRLIIGGFSRLRE